MIKTKFNKIITSFLILAALLSGTVITQAAQSSITTVDSSWGLGVVQSEYISNNRSYDWYIDQGNTGEYSESNCGPSSTIMALKWLNSNFSKTVEDARTVYPENGGWWYTNDVLNYLELNGTKGEVLDNPSESLLKYQLQQGNIIILCIDTTYIPYNDNSEQRVERFYNYKGGHFIVVKGYRVVDGNTYFEVYDPNNWNVTYQDGQPKGKDRYFSSKNLMNAISTWWNHIIVINNQG